jgi:hypothetical protein
MNDITDRIYDLFEKYNSFIKARGLKRAKGVEWALSELNLIKEMLVDFESNELLLHKLGWNTFIGVGLYSGLINTFETKNKKEFVHLSRILKTLLNDIILYTNIGHIISLEVEIQQTDQIQFARIDGTGNIFIFPVDTEDLLIRFEELKR